MSQPRITVVGSSNVDFITQVAKLPAAGETVTDGEYRQVFGGKGANTAVAAARMGGDVTFVSCLGDDPFAPLMLESLAHDGIRTQAVERVPGVSTGTALIMVDAGGENCIAVAPGANGRLDPEMVGRHRQFIADADIVLIQMEIL